MTTATLTTHAPPDDGIKPRDWHPDGWCFRGVTTALALGVSGLYGLLLAEHLGLVGGAVLAGAALAWPLLLAGVWRTSAPAWRRARLDWCLWTMTVGSVAMTLGLLTAAVVPAAGLNPLFALIGGLLLADSAMGWVFARYAPTVQVARPAAVGVWVLGMNGWLAVFCGLALLLERIAR